MKYESLTHSELIQLAKLVGDGVITLIGEDTQQLIKELGRSVEAIRYAHDELFNEKMSGQFGAIIDDMRRAAPKAFKPEAVATPHVHVHCPACDHADPNASARPA